MHQNEEILVGTGSEYLFPSIPRLLDGIRVHLAIDRANAEPRRDVQVNVFCAIEPSATTPAVYSRLRDPAWCSKWDLIGAADPSIIGDQTKARKYTQTPFWVERYVSHTKTFGVSTIMSNKRDHEGQRLRHWFKDNWKITIPGTVFNGNKPAREKDLIQPYPADRRDCFRMMFHLCIENSRSRGYFTEKLMDCFRCKVVPIYWGDPNIGEVFDTSGMILIGDMCGPEIRYMISNLTPGDYQKRLDAIERNATTAEELCEGSNPYPYDKTTPRAMSHRLGILLREAQASYLERKSREK